MRADVKKVEEIIEAAIARGMTTPKPEWVDVERMREEILGRLRNQELPVDERINNGNSSR